MIVGGYAVGVHGYPRYTGDLDVFVEADSGNGQRLESAFRAFGLQAPQLNAAAFSVPDRIVDIGREPVKIQVMTSISGVSFAECIAGSLVISIDDLQVPFIGFTELIKNKGATGRDKDRVDVQELQRVRKP